MKRKEMGSRAKGEYQGDLRPIEKKSGSELRRTGLQERLLCSFLGKVGENGKNCSNGKIGLNVGRAVQRVDRNHQRGLGVACDGVIFFFGGNRRNRGAAERIHTYSVRHHVELFLRITLGVNADRCTQGACQGAQSQKAGDLLCGLGQSENRFRNRMARHNIRSPIV
jgi:hypothetical protein